MFFRVRLLQDGRDFASGLVLTRQEGSRLLLAAGPATNYGDGCLRLDGLPEAVLPVRELRLPFQLDGADARLPVPQQQVFEPTAGPRLVRVRPGPAWLDGRPVRWEPGRYGGGVFADAVLYDGAPRELALGALGPTWITAGVECLGGG